MKNNQLSTISNVLFVILLIVSTILYFFSSCNVKQKNIQDKVLNYFTKNTELLIQEIKLLQNTTANDTHLLKVNLLKSRILYKKIEPIVEYYFQGLSKKINGPALPDIKIDDNQVLPPTGLQQLEALIYNSEIDTAAVNIQTNLLINDLNYCVSQIKHLPITTEQYIELVQQNLIRIAVMGITGFDTPLCNNGLAESASALTATADLVAFTNSKLNGSFKKAINYLNTNNNWETFDRLSFTKQYLMPLSESIDKMMPLPKTIKTQAFSGTLHNLFTGKGWNVDYYVNYTIGRYTNAKATLGKELFYDTKMSSSNNTSCATCHKPELFFTDGLTKARNNVHGGTLARNTPTITYAGLQNNQFYDLRSSYLEDQIYQVITNSEEFNIPIKKLVAKIKLDTGYNKQFTLAYQTDTLNDYMIRNAIATYIRSLNKFNSPLEDFMQGQQNALTQQQKLGYNLYAGKAKCATCHFLPLTNGTIPPFYSKTESEVIGAPKKSVTKNAIIDDDFGRYQQNQLDPLKYAFKTPNLRNVAKTAPYMHNGVFRTLQEVVNFYALGGGVGIGVKNLDHQTLPFDNLKLSTVEIEAIVAFLNALTDKE